MKKNCACKKCKLSRTREKDGKQGSEKGVKAKSGPVHILGKSLRRIVNRIR